METHSKQDLRPQTRVIVDLGALARNVRALKANRPGHTRLMAVVKANGYGHGAVEVARTALDSGAACLAVARISEAVELRDAGIAAPILLFGDILPLQAVYAAKANIWLTLGSLEMALPVSRALKAQGLTARVHVKVDTGMGRLGLVSHGGPDAGHGPGIDKVVEEILAIDRLDGIEVRGMYTHLACADQGDKTHAEFQVDLFSRIRSKALKKGVSIELAHAANSAASIEMPHALFDMIRPGIAMYGLWPSKEVDRGRIDLEPVMSIQSKIIHLKRVPQGFAVSYGSTHVTSVPTTIATIPIGYADGYNRLLSSVGRMLVRGKSAPIIGRICMDFTMIDVGHIPHVELGDNVVILGRQGSEFISADEIAEQTSTINYEVVAGLTGRMPIVYKRGAKV